MLDRYITENYGDLQKMAKTITKGKHPDFEELLHESLLSVYEAARQKMEGLISKKQLKYWIARIMLNQYNSSSSRFHYRYRKHDIRVKDGARYIRQWHEEGDMSHLERRERHLDLLEGSLHQKPFFERYITLLYYREKHSLKSLSEATGISRTTIYKAIKKTRDEIRQESRSWR